MSDKRKSAVVFFNTCVPDEQKTHESYRELGYRSPLPGNTQAIYVQQPDDGTDSSTQEYAA